MDKSHFHYSSLPALNVVICRASVGQIGFGSFPLSAHQETLGAEAALYNCLDDMGTRFIHGRLLARPRNRDLAASQHGAFFPTSSEGHVWTEILCEISKRHDAEPSIVSAHY